jgi:hypothetical protein
MTYNLSEINSGRLEAESFHDYKFNMDMWFIRELGIAYSNSEASTHECSEYYKRKG